MVRIVQTTMVAIGLNQIVIGLYHHSKILSLPSSSEGKTESRFYCIRETHKKT